MICPRSAGCARIPVQGFPDPTWPSDGNGVRRHKLRHAVAVRSARIGTLLTGTDRRGAQVAARLVARTGAYGSRRATNLLLKNGLLAPGRKRVVEGALTGCTLLDRDDGATLVDIDQRHVEPRALLQELQV